MSARAPPPPASRSVHAHVILWLHDDDIEEGISKIRSCMPADWDPTATTGATREDGSPGGDWIKPTAPLHRLLFATVKRKQMHVPVPAGCRKDGPVCCGHFPQPIQTDTLPREDEVKRCFRYYCPGNEHRNVGPYLPVRSCLIISACHGLNLVDIIQIHTLCTLFKPSHPSTTQELTLVFNSHLNVQRVIETAWSFYLLKYALKV